MILQLNKSKQKTFCSLDEILDGRKVTVDTQNGILECLRSRIAQVDANSMDLTDVVEIITDVRRVFVAIKDLSTRKASPKFTGNESDIIIGHLQGREYENETKMKLLALEDGKFMNPQAQKKSKQFTSYKATYPMVITDPYLGNVNKIVSVSQNDACIVGDRRLRKITSNDLDMLYT